MTTSPTTAIHTSPREPLRLRLVPDPKPGALDGAWWPQSRDLHVEAADLIDAFSPRDGRIDRLLYSRPDWDRKEGEASTRKVLTLTRGTIKVGSFPSDDTHLMVATLASGRRLRLLVIPSVTPPARAKQILDEVVHHPSMRTAAEFLGAGHIQEGSLQDGVWDDDGGRGL